VRERTEVAVLAGVGVAAVGLAELALVPARVVQLLDLVVRFAAVAVLLAAGDVRVGLEVTTPLVLIVVVVQANLPLMRL
jgi:hypothetical protein